MLLRRVVYSFSVGVLALLVLDLNGAGAGLLQDADRVGDVDGVAETGVDVDDQRQLDHTTG
jgi:hypothetical protein